MQAWMRRSPAASPAVDHPALYDAISNANDMVDTFGAVLDIETVCVLHVAQPSRRFFGGVLLFVLEKKTSSTSLKTLWLLQIRTKKQKMFYSIPSTLWIIGYWIELGNHLDKKYSVQISSNKLHDLMQLTVLIDL